MSFEIDMGTSKRIHFVGIGGAGMGGIAEVMINQGHQVSGSDINENTVTRHLRDLGATILQGHATANLTNADVVVLSSAIADSNPEVIAAKSANIPIICRAQMLALLMQAKFGIAISGTHGKTTTTSLVASILAQAELHPTFVIGGLLKSVNTNAQLGVGELFVAEADESDASFLYLKPKIAVITNIDEDHLSTYHDDMGELRRSFLKFVDDIPAEGLVVLCADDPIAFSLKSDIKAPCITYGFSVAADIQVTDFKQQGLQSHFTVHDKLSGTTTPLVLNLAGKHNVLNALAAIAVAKKVGVKDAAIEKALQKFMGVGRRFQLYGELELSTDASKVLLIDDYGHHPREIMATVEAIRLVWPERRLIMAYQPHRFSRTQALMSDFAQALSEPDVLLLLDIYPAGEAPIAGVDGAALCQAISAVGKVSPVFVPQIEQLLDTVKQVARNNDILLIQGAGSIGSIAAKMASLHELAQEV